MGWATVLLSGVVAGVISALVSWIGGLHRDKKAAEVETAHRREDVRRERLTDAVVDFLAADRLRFDASWYFVNTVRQAAEGMDSDHRDEMASRSALGEALAELEPRMSDAMNAAQRIGLYAPALYDLARDVYLVNKFDPNKPMATARREQVYRAATDTLVAAARTELGIVP